MKAINNTSEKKVKQGLVVILMIVFSTTLFGVEKPSKVDEKTMETAETEIKLESWMMNFSDWFKGKKEVVKDTVEEEEILLEEWMMNPNHESWKIKSSNAESTEKVCGEVKKEESTSVEAMVEDEEPEMELEDWMTDLSKW